MSTPATSATPAASTSAAAAIPTTPDMRSFFESSDVLPCSLRTRVALSLIQFPDIPADCAVSDETRDNPFVLVLSGFSAESQERAKTVVSSPEFKDYDIRQISYSPAAKAYADYAHSLGADNIQKLYVAIGSLIADIFSRAFGQRQKVIIAGVSAGGAIAYYIAHYLAASSKALLLQAPAEFRKMKAVMRCRYFAVMWDPADPKISFDKCDGVVQQLTNRVDPIVLFDTKYGHAFDPRMLRVAFGEAAARLG